MEVGEEEGGKAWQEFCMRLRGWKVLRCGEANSPAAQPVEAVEPWAGE